MIIFLFALLSAITFSVLIKSFFYWKIIALTVIFFLILSRKRDITFNFFKEIFTFDNRKFFFYCCGIFLLFISFAYFEKFSGGQDARSGYLPLARFLSLNHYLPQSLDNAEKVPLLRTTYPPVIHGLGAILFQIAGSGKEWIASLIPLIFSFLFLVLIFRWSYTYSPSSIVPAIAIFISPFFVERMSWFYQEAPLTFVVTLFFYSLWQFEKDRKNEYLYSAMALSAISMMTKATGIIVVLFLIYFIFSRRLYSKSNLIFFSLFLTIPALWYGNNLYLWGNPSPPLLNSLTIYKPSYKTFAALLKVSGQQNYNVWHNFIFNILSLPFFYIWLFLEIFFVKKLNELPLERDIFIFIVVFCLVWVVTFSSILDFRFFMPFYGYMVVRSVKLIEDMTKDEQKKPAIVKGLFRKTQNIITTKGTLIISTMLILVIGFQYFYVRWIFPDHVTPYLEAVDFLKKEERMHKNKQLIILVDTDHGFRWYGDFIVLEPFQLQVAVDFLKIQKNKDVFNFVKKYNITHIVNSPWKSPWEKNFYRIIGEDNLHFTKCYENKSMVIWRVIT